MVSVSVKPIGIFEIATSNFTKMEEPEKIMHENTFVINFLDTIN